MALVLGCIHYESYCPNPISSIGWLLVNANLYTNPHQTVQDQRGKPDPLLSDE
jgi:hypothetical protein